MKFRTTAVAITMLGITLTTIPTASAASYAETATVQRWIDGDTVVTSMGTVRLIGIDTPEVGQCGADRATALAESRAPAGSQVTLWNPTEVNDLDIHGRHLRYVLDPWGSMDIGRDLIADGAKARYDSQDGWGWHPREATYRWTDNDRPDYSCGTIVVAPPPTGSSATTGVTGWNCPKARPIKGNASSRIYHRPGQRFYKRTKPERCFASRAEARRAGYRASKV